jgi:pimeloyl-ACP methyl ester carboxylesterase
MRPAERARARDGPRSLAMSGNEYLAFGDRRIEYRLVGEGRAGTTDIVMLHEGLGSVSMWKDFPERLAAATGCRVLVYSRHGYGRSSTLARPRTPDYMHEEARIWLPMVLERLGVESPVLFGHSDGGSIALIYAAQPAATIAGIVALAPHVNVEDLTVASIAAAKVAYETATLRDRLAPYHADVDATFWGWNRIWLDAAFRNWNIEALLPSIRAPVLAIQGLDDEYGTLRQVESLCRAVPGAELLALPDCRHSPHRDQPEAVLATTRRFIDRLADGGAGPRSAHGRPP